MVEITDREGLESWLRGKPREVSVAIAARAALRVLPYAAGVTVQRGSRQFDLTVLTSRATLVASVAAYLPTATYAATYAVTYAVTAAATYAAAAATYAAAAVTVAAATNAITAAIYAAATAAAPTDAAFWSNIFRDVALLDDGGDVRTLLSTPLWHGENPVQDEWNAARNRLAARPEDWSFWIDWYQRHLDGRPQNREMLEEIALIDPKDWDRGAAHVNSLIARIQARHLRKATPYAERIEVNTETVRLRSVPAVLHNPRLYQTALDKVRDALEDMRPDGELAQHHAGLAKVAKRLDRALDTYKDNPQRVHDDFLLSAKQIAALVKTGEVADDEDVDALRSTLITGADDIRAADEEVKSSVAARVRLRVEEMRIEDTEVVAEGLEAVAEVSEGMLQESVTEDAEFFRGLYAHAPEGNAPPLGGVDHDESVDRLFRVAAQTSRIVIAVNATGRFAVGATVANTFANMIFKLEPVQTFLLGLFM